MYSEQAYQREQATFEKKLAQQHAQLNKQLWHLRNETFACAADARKALSALVKRYRYFSLALEVQAIERYPDKGRPPPGAQKVVGYRLTGEARRDEAAIAGALTTKGRFILATNDLNTEAYPDAQLLADYKDQQGVERGFRFLKDPWFMVDSIFLKSSKRIEALMMVMALCLLVYNVAQYRLRQRLKDEHETLPNQLNKPVQNPTLRWLFQLMEGISLVRLGGELTQGVLTVVVTNLTEVRKKIIRLFGDAACLMYGLIPKTSPQGLGM